ncbi:L,D-transpeptidase family protein [Paracoccus aestuariivivens]|uniref:L,D-transpeptidase family protein n=1 Tax=Paracoccus aestuariivivens TaxID=1820333 RepID=A0A6L6J6E0_9RHOB|nr:L,D-transpeptidase family protein [Paracoccus aestuariivivens]MTH77672.1 L,D-transpeptidase family protein [Paracoccus aestuariivivens]
MRRLGALFSALCLVAVLWGLWLLWAPQKATAPVAPPRPAEGWSLPGLPRFRLPHFDLPQFHLPDLGLPSIQPKPVPELPITSPVERILIEKAARKMTVFQRNGGSRTFRIALGFSPDGDKSRQGDGRTPEGTFHIDRLNRQSAYHLSLGLDYPQRRHREAARKAGYDPGGDIMIHGQPNQIADGFKVKGDWTAGCIALTNPEIEEIFAHAAIGTQVEIRP